MKQYYLIYVTANDSPLDKDYINLFLSRKFFPGVTPVQLYLVVSSVRKFSHFHRWMLRRIISMLESGRHIKCKMAILKNNAITFWSETEARGVRSQMDGIKDILISWTHLTNWDW